MDLTKGLNAQQKEAVLHTEGPLLILAGAGSGKTNVLTHRIVYLIREKGVLPENILAITFTNKAAKEMKERTERLLGEESRELWVSTFHAACVRILRRDIEKLGYTRSFVIFDTSDQQTLIKDCIKELGLNEKNFPPREVLDKIGRAKDELIEPDIYAKMNEADYRLSNMAKIYKLYQEKLKRNNALDFDDIIIMTIKLLLDNPPVLSYYQRRFKYVLVDEYQDTNTAQYMLVSMLARQSRNLCVVGDDDQCLPEGTGILTERGVVNIEDIEEGQCVRSASGRGNVLTGTVEKKIKKRYTGPVVRIRTANGREITATPNHIGFARLNPQPGAYYVYLMYKKGKGYRLGQTQGVRSRNGEIVNGLFVRLNQEHGDKMWILRVCSNKEEATYYEQFFAFRYGIPTVVFQAAGRNLAMSQAYIDKMFDELDTVDSAEQLMNDLMIFEEYPHHICNAVVRGQSVRQFVNVTSFGGRKTGEDSGWCSHRICLNTSGSELKEKFRQKEFPIRNGNRSTWRIETERSDYDDADLYVKKIAAVEENIEILKRARLTENDSFMYMPFSHMKPTMSVAVYENGKIVEDIIEEVSVEQYDGYVYDLSVPHYRQYIADGVVVHNSIYGWRGANIRNILDFEKEFENCKVVRLEQNYRSTKTILNAANNVIKNNIGRKRKSLWTENDQGCGIVLCENGNEHDEASFVVNEIKKLMIAENRECKEFAILYRINAQSRVLEDALMREGLPYRIFGGLKFYDRKEIKDLIAYLRLVQNPADDVALKRIINVPKRGIGATTVEHAQSIATGRKCSIFSIVSSAAEIPELKKQAAKLDNFVSIIAQLKAVQETMSVHEFISEVMDKSGILQELQEEDTVEAQTRIENIKEFKSVALDFENQSEEKGLEAFLANISLVADIDNMEEEQDNVVLMTLHSAKGLEFPVVFMVGMEDGVFPGTRSIFDETELEEERRLCYVGMTRAREKLYMTNTFTRTLFGNTTYNKASRFLKEIPEECFESYSKKPAANNAGFMKGTGGMSTAALFGNTSVQADRNYTSAGFGAGNSASVSGKNFTAGSGKPAAPQEAARSTTAIGFGRVINSASDVSRVTSSQPASQFKEGDRVQHKKFGEGTILSVEKENGDFKLEIQFKNHGMKRLMAAFANLTKL